ncbi:hypothetical protein Drose_21425 [Dactylosporangium roseum]|uniref:Uncharacterized protein n=1 Tax=Dactylosporangium roseum TaxID=47989 RepID=A0ABY5YVR7_9ACTN|nr:hypothetical protein [Dactylosporangium roseum]UWZ33835.1 hypothetical protein Drose_21425 [Dactylosporangium roseum]
MMRGRPAGGGTGPPNRADPRAGVADRVTGAMALRAALAMVPRPFGGVAMAPPAG